MARARSILILGLNYAPEPVGIGPYTASMAEGLVERGWHVEVIAGSPYYPQWRRYPGYGRLWRRDVAQGVTITRCAHYVPARPSGLKRIVHLASFAISALLPTLRGAARSPDAVMCVVPALLSVPVGWFAARLSRAKLWVHVQDFEVEAAFATGLLDHRGRSARAARCLENALLGLADKVSSISPRMVDRLHQKGIAASKAVEIRNWADARFRASDAGRLRESWGLTGKHVALYSGNIANKQGIEILIEAARLLAYREDIVFVICGQGPNRARLQLLARDLANVQLHDLQPAEQMGELLALADVHLLPQIAEAADLVLPSKLTNMLGSGRPVVATASLQSGLAEEVEGCGVVTPPGDAAALAQAIAGLVDDPAQRDRLGRAAGLRAQERWSRDAILDRLDAELQALAAGR